MFKGIDAARFAMEHEMSIGRNVIDLRDLRLCGRARRLALEPWSVNARDAYGDA